ncbi:MGMT family protein [Leptolyngbya sp. KIOST-1]|uniref:MGMT family protein n=1 Tax=Leptolyngbya sp. KIOST-1 TaxID=1229172 RepID=UPI0006906B9E|nr:MGMT family protein [Leptolyngbya sp. KIOST-1]
MTTYDRIYAVVRQIPRGKVATYGQVAELAGLVGKPRLVGYALYRVDMSIPDVPWQRVINARGEVSESPLRNGTDYIQRAMLEDEGVEFDHRGRVDLSLYKWRPPDTVIEQALAAFRERFDRERLDQ